MCTEQPGQHRPFWLVSAQPFPWTSKSTSCFPACFQSTASVRRTSWLGGPSGLKDTIVEFSNGVKIGGDEKIRSWCGPCSIESREQIFLTAKQVREAGATFLRGGAFKPRSSPYAFQGMGIPGLKLMREAAEAQVGLAGDQRSDGDRADYEPMLPYVDLLPGGRAQHAELQPACAELEQGTQAGALRSAASRPRSRSCCSRASTIPRAAATTTRDPLRAWHSYLRDVYAQARCRYHLGDSGGHEALRICRSSAIYRMHGTRRRDMVPAMAKASSCSRGLRWHHRRGSSEPRQGHGASDGAQSSLPRCSSSCATGRRLHEPRSRRPAHQRERSVSPRRTGDHALDEPAAGARPYPGHRPARSIDRPGATLPARVSTRHDHRMRGQGSKTV